MSGIAIAHGADEASGRVVQAVGSAIASVFGTVSSKCDRSVSFCEPVEGGKETGETKEAKRHCFARKHNLKVDTKMAEAQHFLDEFLEDYKKEDEDSDIRDTEFWETAVIIRGKDGRLKIRGELSSGFMLSIDYDTYKSHPNALKKACSSSKPAKSDKFMSA